MQITATAGSGAGGVVAASTRSSSRIAAGTPLFSCPHTWTRYQCHVHCETTDNGRQRARRKWPKDGSLAVGFSFFLVFGRGGVDLVVPRGKSMAHSCGMTHRHLEVTSAAVVGALGIWCTAGLLPVILAAGNDAKDATTARPQNALCRTLLGRFSKDAREEPSQRRWRGGTARSGHGLLLRVC